jgi:1-acyl-sn-glycerol-3-phosphate acyltransferase
LNFSRVLYWFGGKFIKAYTKVMLRMSVVSHLPIPKGAKIIVANHPTTSDPFILTSVSNGQAAVLIKNVLFDIPLFGKYLYFAGHIPVKVDQGKIAFEKALKLLKKGVTIIVFIEGDLSRPFHRMGRPKTGAVRLALSSGAPIIPIGISVKKIHIKNLRSVIKGVQEWGRWYFRGPYALTIGKSMNFSGSAKNTDRVRNLSGWLTGKIKILQKESAKRIK